MKYREISEKYFISLGGITKIIKKMDSAGSVQFKYGNGRKRVLEELTDRAIYRLVKAEPEISSRIIEEVLSLPAS